MTNPVKPVGLWLTGTYTSALWLVLPAVPLFGIAATITAYSLHSGNEHALSGGLAATFVIWLVLGVAASNLVSPAGANPRAWEAFEGRLATLTAHFKAMKDCPPQCACGPQHAAVREAQAQLDHIAAIKASRDSRWVRMIGYVSMWQALHDAEESLIETSDYEAISAGLCDEQRLEGSNVPRRKELLQRLRAALLVLDPCNRKYFVEQPQPIPANDPPGVDNKKTARRIVRDVRTAFNTYLEDLYAALARTRNNLLTQITSASLTLYLLLALALLAAGDRQAEAFQTAGSFLAVGSFVGLISGWSGQKKSDKTVEDFGLARAQLLQGFMLSGVAGFLGALLYLAGPGLVGIDLTPDEVNSEPGASASPTPTPRDSPAEETIAPADTPLPPESTGSTDGPAGGNSESIGSTSALLLAVGDDLILGGFVAQGGGEPAGDESDGAGNVGRPCPDPAAGEAPHLRCIFRFDTSSILIAWLFAAAFGLAPDRMFNLLNRQTQQFKEDIQSTKATEVGQGDP